MVIRDWKTRMTMGALGSLFLSLMVSKWTHFILERKQLFEFQSLLGFGGSSGVFCTHPEHRTGAVLCVPSWQWGAGCHLNLRNPACLNKRDRDYWTFLQLFPVLSQPSLPCWRAPVTCWAAGAGPPQSTYVLGWKRGIFQASLPPILWVFPSSILCCCLKLHQIEISAPNLNLWHPWNFPVVREVE